MTLIIAFVTDAAAVLQTIEDKKSALLPADVRANGYAGLGGVEPSITAFDTRRSKNVYDLLDWLDWEHASGVMLLTDDSLPGLIGLLGDQFNLHAFTPPAYGLKTANQLTSTISKCLRAYRFLATRFADAKYQHIFRLPLRNFDAPEIARMQAACRDMTQRNYGREVDAVLHSIRKRQLPKKASEYDDRYYIDDNGKHFQFGPEHHGLAETNIPPHSLLCIIANQLRFGQRFDGTFHYNVSRMRNRSMIRKYPNCHGALAPNKRRSHINMFTNDFFN